MNKKLLIASVIVGVLIIAAAIYFFNLFGNNQYCNLRLGWNHCNGKIVRVTGRTDLFVSQHPMMNDRYLEFQSYLGVGHREIILLSKEEINCPGTGMTVIGNLTTGVGPCEDVPGKESYCGGLLIKVDEWECS
jgi:hypothetical protein